MFPAPKQVKHWLFPLAAAAAGAGVAAVVGAVVVNMAYRWTDRPDNPLGSLLDEATPKSAACCEVIATKSLNLTWDRPKTVLEQKDC